MSTIVITGSIAITGIGSMIRISTGGCWGIVVREIITGGVRVVVVIAVMA